MKNTVFFLLFLSLLTAPLANTHAKSGKKEVSLRLSPKLGALFKLKDGVLGRAVRRFVYILPEGNLNIQITEHWFASASFIYAKFRGKLAGGSGGHINVYGPTAGIKLVSSSNATSSGDFLDDSRWWFGLESGPYFTDLRVSPVVPPQRSTGFGFNFGAGFDYFFHENWAAGLETKLHYVNLAVDDYYLLSFGPHLIARF